MPYGLKILRENLTPDSTMSGWVGVRARYTQTSRDVATVDLAASGDGTATIWHPITGHDRVVVAVDMRTTALDPVTVTAQLGDGPAGVPVVLVRREGWTRAVWALTGDGGATQTLTITATDPGYGGDVDFSLLLVEPGDGTPGVVPSWFDGDTAAVDGMIYGWLPDGTAYEAVEAATLTESDPRIPSTAVRVELIRVSDGAERSLGDVADGVGWDRWPRFCADETYIARAWSAGAHGRTRLSRRRGSISVTWWSILGRGCRSG